MRTYIHTYFHYMYGGNARDDPEHECSSLAWLEKREDMTSSILLRGRRRTIFINPSKSV
jgi:hypothetical protein